MVSKTNYITQRCGTVTVIREFETHITPNGSRQRIFHCKCDCGNEFDIRLNSLKKIECCFKCAAKNRRVDVTCKRYGHLVVLSMADDYISPFGDRLSRCLCKCDCGREKIVNLSELTTGKTLSCGCLRNTIGLLKDNEILMDKYDFERNKNLNLNKLTSRSSKKVWWLGKCGHEWKSTPNKRCYDNAQCPVCYRENKSPSIVCIETNIKYKNAKKTGQKLNIKSYKSIYKCVVVNIRWLVDIIGNIRRISELCMAW